MNPILVEVTRGGRVESAHRGAIAVCDASGRIFASWGDIEAAVYPRSAFKSLQALALVESGAADAFGVTPDELALACASHSGEPMHVERVERWLARIDCQESDLACGPHLPINEAAAHAMIQDGRKPCRVHNNCSGKHTGFLTLARHLGVAVSGYERPDHPVQNLVRLTIAEMCELTPQALPVAIDGCGAANYALPLSRLAMGMARLGACVGGSEARARAAKRILTAWKSYPLLISGTGRTCCDLIANSIGGTVVKTGAEGVFTAVLPEQGLGVAIKIDDGAARAAETAVAQVLVLLKSVDPESAAIAKYVEARVRNWEGTPVGTRRPSAPLLSGFSV